MAAAVESARHDSRERPGDKHQTLESAQHLGQHLGMYLPPSLPTAPCLDDREMLEVAQHFPHLLEFVLRYTERQTLEKSLLKDLKIEFCVPTYKEVVYFESWDLERMLHRHTKHTRTI